MINGWWVIDGVEVRIIIEKEMKIPSNGKDFHELATMLADDQEITSQLAEQCFTFTLAHPGETVMNNEK